MESSTKISKEDLGGQPKCCMVRFPVSSPCEGNAKKCEKEDEASVENLEIKKCK